jgi:hypothetical protein
LAFTLGELDDGVSVLTVCRSCGTFKTLVPDVLPIAARPLQLRALEGRVVCGWRGRDGRKPPCGGRVEFSIEGLKAGRSPLRNYDYGTP